MTKRWMSGWCAVVVLSIGGPAAFAQLADKVEFTPGYGVGDRVSYRFERSLTVEQTSPDAPARTAAASIMMELILERQPDAMDGTRVFAVSVDAASISSRVEVGGEARSEYAASAPAVGEPNEQQLAFAEAVAEAQISLAVSPEGTVEALGGVDVIQRAWFEQTGASGDAVLGLLSQDVLGGSLEPIFNADGAAPARRVGSGWQQREDVELPPVGVITISRSSSLAELDAGLATIEGDLEATLRVVPSDDPLAVQLSLDAAEGESTLLWDLEDGELVSRSSTERIVTNWRTGDRSLRQTQRSEQKLTQIDSD